MIIWIKLTMNSLDQVFFNQSNWTKEKCQKIINNCLVKFDDGELYLQESNSESIVFDDQKVSNASYNKIKGFGLRGILGEVASYAHSTDFSENSLIKASEVVESILKYNKPINQDLEKIQGKHNLYQPVNPIAEIEFAQKIALAKEIDDYVRSKNPFVRQVTIRISGGYSSIGIIKKEFEEFFDIRPITQLVVSVTLMKNGKLESAGEIAGGRRSFSHLFTQEKWKSMADKAIETAMIKLDAENAPAGELKVVLGNGDPGILLHEAVGHGLEGDFNRKETSAFSGLIGKQVASKGVTVIDDGTIPELRGSLNFDDEGTPTGRNLLIEDGILVGYMQDRMNARLMNMKPTGNGRRESYAHQPMPRMTNTFMLAGEASQADMIKDTKDGIYFPKFKSGQVDITSGKFVFEADLAYIIENGKLTKPVKGATLIGNGPNVMKKIVAIGNDFALDAGAGMCGKEGQSVPVGVGQPSLLIDKITVGGTKI